MGILLECVGMDTGEVMKKARELAVDSGLTCRVIGLRMGYPERSASQSVSQFLRGSNPTLGMLGRFGGAMGVGVEFFLCETMVEEESDGQA